MSQAACRWCSRFAVCDMLSYTLPQYTIDDVDVGRLLGVYSRARHAKASTQRISMPYTNYY